MGNEHTAQNTQNRDFLLVDSSNSRPLIGREDHQQKSKGLTLIQKCKFGIVNNAKYAGTNGESGSTRGAILALYTMPNMLAPMVNREVLGECIFGIAHNAKYAFP